jgi:hypothetical protein
MNLRLRRTHQLALAIAFAVAIVVSLALEPSGASATAPADVVPFKQARLSPKLQEIVVRVAGREGVATATLVTVAPAVSGAMYAGVFVGSDASGADVVAPYNADGMMAFSSLDRATAYGGVMVFPSAAGEAGEVRRVSLVGLAEPRVAALTIKVADGSSLRAELVRAGQRGFRFFAYATDASSRFPISYRALAADGTEIKTEDVSQALMPPAGSVG